MYKLLVLPKDKIKSEEAMKILKVMSDIQSTMGTVRLVNMEAFDLQTPYMYKKSPMSGRAKDRLLGAALKTYYDIDIKSISKENKKLKELAELLELFLNKQVLGKNKQLLHNRKKY